MPDHQVKHSGQTGSTLDPVELTVNRTWFPRLVLIGCVLCEITFFLLDYFVNYGRGTDISTIRVMFSTSNEGGIASWFAICQTLLSGMTLWGIFAIVKARRGLGLVALGWMILALFFTYMAIDDGVKFHERMGTVYKVLKDRNNAETSFPSYFWQVVFLPFFGLMGLFMVGFLWTQLTDGVSRVLIVVALGLLISAVGLDFIEGLNANHKLNLYTIMNEKWPGIDPWTREHFKKPGFDALHHFSKSIEEVFMESLANSLLWFCYIRYILKVADNVRIRTVGRV